VAAGCIFAVFGVRAFALPPRVAELGGDRVPFGLLVSVGTFSTASVDSG
jgi:hypothetical protein